MTVLSPFSGPRPSRSPGTGCLRFSSVFPPRPVVVLVHDLLGDHVGRTAAVVFLIRAEAVDDEALSFPPIDEWLAREGINGDFVQDARDEGLQVFWIFPHPAFIEPGGKARPRDEKGRFEHRVLQEDRSKGAAFPMTR